jgi:RHS repeat-associated protein
MFTIRTDQKATLRKQRLGDELAKSFEGANQKASVDPASGDVVITDPLGRSIRCTFDERGFIGKVVGPLGRTYRLENNGDGDVIGLTVPSGLHVGLDRDSTGRITHVTQGTRTLYDLEYDEVPICVSALRYPDQTSVRFRYHDPSRLSSIANRLGHAISFEYDELGRLSALTDGNGRSTAFRYGNWSRPDATVFVDGSTEAYEYDPNGRVRRIVAGAEPFAEITYDEADRPIEIRYGDGELVRFAYDGQGNVVEAANPELTVRYEYNDAGQVVKEDQAGQVVEYRYNSAGDLVGMICPTGEAVAFHRDEELRLDSVTDWAGGFHRFTYADKDRGYAHIFPNGLKAEVAQADTGQPIAITIHPVNSIGRIVCRLKFQYDNEDRLRAFTDSDFGTKTYIYDAESQLLEVRVEDGENEVFAYDPAGNRTSRNGTKAEFNDLDQLISQGTTHCGYDARANLESYIGHEGRWRFTYNRRNLLVRAESGAGRVVKFGYDAFGRRLWKKSGAKEIRYVWAGEQLVREVETNGPQTVTRDYLYQPGTFTPLALRINEEIYCYHTDHLGTPVRMTDSRGRVVWSAEYRAFGEAITRIHQVPNFLRFPGQYFDEETGLHYNRFRYYSPILGRYLTRDPLTFLAGVNFYAYVDNDPINATDPLGLKWWKTALAIAGGIVAGVAATVALVALAPVALPLAILAGGAVAGAVGGGLNEGLNNGWCLKCVAWAALKGAAVGIIASLPFAWLPLSAGVLAFMGAGGAGGALGYTADWLANPGAKWNWRDFGLAVGIGVVTAGLGRYLGGKYVRWKQARAAPPPPDPALVQRTGPLQEPAFVRPGEGTRPATARDARPGQPMELSTNESDTYLYVTKEDGTQTYAPQKRLPNGQETVKHTDLAEGGPARTSGEIKHDPLTDNWVMDDNSGRYSAQEGPDGRWYGTRTQDNVDAAAELARQSGTQQKIYSAQK